MVRVMDKVLIKQADGDDHIQTCWSCHQTGKWRVFHHLVSLLVKGFTVSGGVSLITGL